MKRKKHQKKFKQRSFRFSNAMREQKSLEALKHILYGDRKSTKHDNDS
jgi:hypothetical protein